ncbi:unnamed protein product [Dibothriocephalus latus]|uniref:C2H2-type domain-containing protein n=1 Tax=Dibothriocephalus latus TaxID=60516 RepID=A0A3P6V5G3_DIBLA|nr:unnamed protein product [Dibothriocephalus latus]
MEIEPQIGFWKTFDEPSQDEYISWQEDFTQASDGLNATEYDPVELPDSFSSTPTAQEVNLEPKLLENNPLKAPSCVVSSIPIQRRLEIPPSKDETVKKPGVAPRSPKIKYAIKNNSPQSKLVIKLVPKKPSSHAVDVSKTLCLICERTFFDQRSLNTHLTRMHAPTRNLRDNPANRPIATNPATSGSNCTETGSQREPSVCTVAPVAKEYTSPITSMSVPSYRSSPAAKLEVASGRQNRDKERRATAPASTTFLTQNSPSIHPNLKRPLSDVMADCPCYPGRTGGDISSESCTQQTLRSSVSLPAPRCTAEAQNCASSLARLVFSSPITTATPSSNPRPCEACMKLHKYKSENQIETTAKMLLGKTYELLMEINKRPLDVVKPLVNALQRLIFTVDTKVFVAYMNFVLPETSRTAVANPFLKRILSQPALPNNKPQDASRSPIEQPSNNFHAGLQEASGPDKNCDGIRCRCSAKRFKGTLPGIRDYNSSDFGNGVIPSGSHLMTANPRTWEPANAFHSSL